MSRSNLTPRHRSAAAPAGEIDASAAALTITTQRERVLDFSHPFYTSGLGVAVPRRSEVTWLSASHRIVSPAFLKAAGTADAFVYDLPILRYAVKDSFGQSVQVLPKVFLRQDYGIAIPQGAPIRETLNQEILRITTTPEWKRVLNRYLGRL